MQYFRDNHNCPGMNMQMPVSAMQEQPMMHQQMPAVHTPEMHMCSTHMQDINPFMPNLPPCMMQQQYMMQQQMPGMGMQDQYTYPQNFPEALKLMKDAVAGEREDEIFYDYLIKSAPSEEDKKIISSIRDDERKHNKLFREMYYELTGQMLPPSTETEFTKPASYLAGIQKALFGELGAVERYRKILFAMQSRKHINMMTEIITDELKHASKYNFIYAKNKK